MQRKQRRWYRYGIHMMMVVLFLVIIGFNKKADAAISEETTVVLKETVVKAYQNYQTEVDVSGFGLIDSEDAATLRKVMTQVINETPYIFYAGQQYSKEIVSESGKIKTIHLAYAATYLNSDNTVNVKRIQNTRKKLNKAVKKAMKSIKSSMSNLEKALILHDYIVQNTAYEDDENKQYRLNETGVFLYQQANCQGYSRAYALLLEKAGIPVKYITSESMGHVWNLVKVGKQWYHVDVTWDDPVDANALSDQYGLVRHRYFMASTEYFKKNKHSGFTAEEAIQKNYDKKFWRNVNSAFQYRKGKWIFLNSTGLMQRRSLVKGKAKVLKQLKGKALIQFNSNKYYLIAYNCIYMYNCNNGKLRVVWRTSSKYGEKYYLTQIKYADRRISYRVLRGKKHKTGSIIVKKDGFAA